MFLKRNQSRDKLIGSSKYQWIILWKQLWGLSNSWLLNLSLAQDTIRSMIPQRCHCRKERRRAWRFPLPHPFKLWFEPAASFYKTVVDNFTYPALSVKCRLLSHIFWHHTLSSVCILSMVLNAWVHSMERTIYLKEAQTFVANSINMRTSLCSCDRFAGGGSYWQKHSKNQKKIPSSSGRYFAYQYANCILSIHESGMSYEQQVPDLSSLNILQILKQNFQQSEILLTIIFSFFWNPGWPSTQPFRPGGKVRYKHQRSECIGYH